MRCTLQFFLLGAMLISWAWASRGESADEALARATVAVQAAAQRAQADPARPIFHLTAPAQWINDPNGPIYLDGIYHLYNQQNPFENKWGHMSWGHAVSRDLVHWQQLPVALPERNTGLYTSEVP